MSSNALAKAQDELARYKARVSNAREKANRGAKVMQRDAVAVVAAYGYGSLKKDRQRSNQQMPSVLGLDPEVTAVIALYAVGHFADGDLGEFAHDAALGIACGAAMKKASE